MSDCGCTNQYLDPTACQPVTIYLPGPPGPPGTGAAPTIHGSLSSPITFDPTVGLTIASAETDQIWFLSTGISGGEQLVTALLQISNGTIIGQKLTLVGTDSSNNYIFQGTAGAVVNGLSQNGDCTIDNNQCIEYFWDGAKWYEKNRRR